VLRSLSVILDLVCPHSMLKSVTHGGISGARVFEVFICQ
jgi:hypothetical protein